MTRRQQLSLWRRNEKKRIGLYARYERKAYNMLSSQLRRVQNEIEENGLEITSSNLNLLVPAEDAQKLIIDLYSKVGEEFFQQTRSDVRKKFKDTGIPFSSYLQKFTNLYAAEKVTAITDTTREELKAVIFSLVQEGFSIPNAAKEIRKRVRETFRNRAKVISRTEVISASNFGNLSGAQSIEDELGMPLRKVWLATPDVRTRASHRAANGQRQGLEDAFIVRGERLQYPGDPAGSAGNVIQCRCTMFYEEIS